MGSDFSVNQDFSRNCLPQDLAEVRIALGRSVSAAKRLNLLDGNRKKLNLTPLSAEQSLALVLKVSPLRAARKEVRVAKCRGVRQKSK